MNRREWLERTGFALAAGFAGCKSGSSPYNHQGRISSVSIGVNKGGPVILQTPAAEFRVLASGYVQAFLRKPGGDLTLDDPPVGSGGSLSYLVSGGRRISNFEYDFGPSIVSDASGKIGPLGKRIEIPAHSPEGIEKTLALEIYDDFPNLALITESYRNVTGKELAIDRVAGYRRWLNASLANRKVAPYRMWSFQGAAREQGEDMIQQVTEQFPRPGRRDGQPSNSMGSGVPVLALWTERVGIGMGHLELLPLALALPVKVGSGNRVEASMELEPEVTLKAGETYSLPQSFISIYEGDFYKPLRTYSRVLQRKGWSILNPGEQNYDIGWNSNGYGQDVTPQEMQGTIPKLKEFGAKWVTLDYRWFNNFGDWEPRQDTFPGNSIRKLAKDFHQEGLFIQLAWQPLAVDDGEEIKPHQRNAAVSRVVRDHPDWLILDKNGKHARLMSREGEVAVLCPALREVQQYCVGLTQRFIRDWDYDGSRLDSIFNVPPCYNPKHHHKSPEDSIRAMSRVFQGIFETSQALKSHSVTQICSCGAPPNFALLPYMSQAAMAGAEPDQIRRRITIYKALLGPRAAVCGNHFEGTGRHSANTRHATNPREGFSSTVGAGGVVGTGFVWPEGAKRRYKGVYLTPARAATIKKWTDIYNREMLSAGTFLNLYNYGYDFPEGYAIRKDGKMYYAFYASGPRVNWKGELELRGLDPGQHRVYDYVNEKDLGRINASNPRLKTVFEGRLLVEVSKV